MLLYCIKLWFVLWFFNLQLKGEVQFIATMRKYAAYLFLLFNNILISLFSLLESVPNLCSMLYLLFLIMKVE